MGEVSGVVRIAIVDDHPVARRGLEYVLSAVPDLAVVASVGSLAELRDLLPDGPAPSTGGPEPSAEPGPGPATGPPSSKGTQPDAGWGCDVVVLDLYLDGDLPCLDAVVELTARYRVLVMSASGRPADVLGAVRAGAAGYLTKESSDELIVAAVATVASGGFALSPRLADILHAELSRVGSPRPRGDPALSAREEEALRLISRGFTHAQAARRMGVSKATVDTYVERIRAKLQVGNKAELAVAAYRLLDEQGFGPR